MSYSDLSGSGLFVFRSAMGKADSSVRSSNKSLDRFFKGAELDLFLKGKLTVDLAKAPSLKTYFSKETPKVVLTKTALPFVTVSGPRTRAMSGDKSKSAVAENVRLPFRRINQSVDRQPGPSKLSRQNQTSIRQTRQAKSSSIKSEIEDPIFSVNQAKKAIKSFKTPTSVLKQNALAVGEKYETIVMKEPEPEPKEPNIINNKVRSVCRSLFNF